MRSHIWTCDEYHRTLVQKATSHSPGSRCFCVIHWGYDIPDCIPQLERYRRVSTNRHLSIPFDWNFAQVRMDDENHRVHLAFRAGNCEFGMRFPYHICPPAPAVIYKKADNETQTAPGLRLWRPIQSTTIQVTSLLGVHRIRLRSLPRSLHRSVRILSVAPRRNTQP